MKYQIDQSIKIENTAKTTYVCLANGKTVIASISATEKRLLKLYFRDLDKPVIFKLFTFSVLCAKILIEAKPGNVTIDREYAGHERQIKSFILQIFRIEGFSEPVISFGEIGKKSSAHLEGYRALQKDRRGIVITAKAVWQYYEKIDKK